MEICSRLKNKMAGIKFSRKELEKHFKITEEIKEKISLFGTHLESMNDNEVELEILPNRPDLFSLHGFAKSFLAFIGKKTGLRKYKVKEPEKDYKVNIDKSVLEIRPYTACAIIKNISFDDEKIKEVIDIQEKIHTTLGRNRRRIAIGIYPLEKITLPITFKAQVPKDIKFIPLEMDREMNGLQILQQHPTGREYAHLLEGKEKFPIFIDGQGEILSMPPIINSHKTGKITGATKDVFIECSGFDLKILKKTVNILATMFAEMGGEIYQMEIKHKEGNYITPNLTPEKMKISIEKTNKLLGLELNEKQMKECLEKMGYDYDKSFVEIPAWRTDIMHEVDLIEDIAIAYGYEKFIPEVPQISTVGEINKIETIKKKISEILTGLGMLETSSYHLMTKEDIKGVGLKNAIEVEDSKSDFKYLRHSLLLSNLKILRENVDSEYPQRIFELGRIFEKTNEDKEETGIKETEMLCVTLAEGKTGFTEAKQIVDCLTRMLGKEYKIEPEENPSFIKGRCAKIISAGKDIGHFGELTPSIINNIKAKTPVSAIEINIDRLIEQI